MVLNWIQDQFCPTSILTGMIVSVLHKTKVLMKDIHLIHIHLLSSDMIRTSTGCQALFQALEIRDQCGQNPCTMGDYIQVRSSEMRCKTR